MKNDSTPSEGWEEKIFYILKSFEQAIRFCLSMKHSAQSEKEILVHKKHAYDSLIYLISQEIAKARQEVMMTELVHCEEAIERARQEARQEIAEWAKRYDKRNDGINKSDLIKKLEEEK